MSPQDELLTESVHYSVYYIPFFNNLYIKAKAKRFKLICVRLHKSVPGTLHEVLKDVIARYVTSMCGQTIYSSNLIGC